jgi:hypothetical protein
MVNVVPDYNIAPYPDQMKCSQLQLTIDPERIHFLKFILEGYDGLAIQSTVDAKAGIVEIRYPPEVESDLQSLLVQLKPLISKSNNRSI